MGRIKSKLIKRTSRKLREHDKSLFSENFEDNKKSLCRSLPSKKLRNKIAGYLARLTKNKDNLIDDKDGTE